jgi:hypothetical protein
MCDLVFLCVVVVGLWTHYTTGFQSFNRFVSVGCCLVSRWRFVVSVYLQKLNSQPIMKYAYFVGF